MVTKFIQIGTRDDKGQVRGKESIRVLTGWLALGTFR